jgi:hypothetical protein
MADGVRVASSAWERAAGALNVVQSSDIFKEQALAAPPGRRGARCSDRPTIGRLLVD